MLSDQILQYTVLILDKALTKSFNNKVEKSTKRVYYSRMKIFNNKPLNIKRLSHDTKKFKLAFQ